MLPGAIPVYKPLPCFQIGTRSLEFFIPESSRKPKEKCSSPCRPGMSVHKPVPSWQLLFKAHLRCGVGVHLLINCQSCVCCVASPWLDFGLLAYLSLATGELDVHETAGVLESLHGTALTAV